MKANLPLITVAVLMLHAFVFKAQGPVFQEATLARAADTWQLIKFEDGTNAKNNVQFYAHEGKCDSSKVKFIKLINLNPYPVIFSYQISADNPVVNVRVPASFSLEGSCKPADDNIAKLTIQAPPIKTEEDTKKYKGYFKSHIGISPVQQ